MTAERQHVDLRNIARSVGLLAAIIEGSEDAIVAKDVHGVIIGWNPGAERLFGYLEQEVVGRHISMLVPDHRRGEERDILARVLGGQRIKMYETERRRKDGTIVPVALTISPLRDRDGRIVGASKIARDITERRTALERQARLAAIVESSDDAIYSKTPTGIVDSWNRAAEQLFGYAADEIIGKDVRMLLPPDQRDEENEILRRVLAAERIEHYETRRLHRDGHLVELSLTISPLAGADGTIIGASVIARDISEQRRAHIWREQLAAIVESSEEAILSKDVDGIVTSWNPAAERLYGYAAEEMVGRSISILTPPDRDGEDENLVHRVMSGTPLENHHVRRRRKDGSIIDVSLTISPIRDASGTVVGASTIARDLSQQKEAEQLLERANAELRRVNALKTSFLAMASHELRTPLTAISGFTSTMLAMEDALTDEQRRNFLEIIDRQARRLHRLVEDLLTLSQIESGKLRTQPAPVDVSLTIKQILAEFGGTGIDVSCPPGLVAACDEHHLEQILVNFVANARKYGAEPISIEADESDEGIVIRVRDAGLGVPESFRPRLFDSFQRFEAHAHIEGTGLGLSIVRGLAEAQGGDAWYEPATPNGACFCVRVPAHSA